MELDQYMLRFIPIKKKLALFSTVILIHGPLLQSSSISFQQPFPELNCLCPINELYIFLNLQENFYVTQSKLSQTV